MNTKQGKVARGQDRDNRDVFCFLLGMAVMAFLASGMLLAVRS